jgi:cytochrome c553
MKRALLMLMALLGASLAHLPLQAQTLTGDVQAGARKVSMCIGCHAIPGYQASFPEIHRVPMISGQSKAYLVSALTAYRKGDRRHPTMRGVARSLSDQDIADIAAYYASHGGAGNPEVPPTPAPAPVRVAALLERGACMQCHGANMNSPIDPSFPKIAGQHADYLFVSMRAYRIEGNRKVGRNNAVMQGIVRQFTDAELRLMAEYISTLPGNLHTVPARRFR